MQRVYSYVIFCLILIVMKKINLHDKFVAELNSKFPKKIDLVNPVSNFIKFGEGAGLPQNSRKS